MLNNIGLPGLLLLSPFFFAAGMGLYSLAKIPNKDMNFHYAGFWLRVLALIVDSIINFIIVLIPAISLGYFIGLNMADSATQYEIEATAEAVGQLLGIVVVWLYYAIMESSKYQATIGKKIFGLRVVDLDGNRISFGKATGRHFGKFISMLTVLIGYFMIGWTKRKQGLHDKMAGCLVVRANNQTQNYDSGFGVKNEPSIYGSVTSDGDNFEAEAMRRYKDGELSEEAFMEIIKPKK